MKRRSILVRLFLLFAVLAVAVLQILLPIACYRSTVPNSPVETKARILWPNQHHVEYSFWGQRFRFNQFLRPGHTGDSWNSPQKIWRATSATFIQDELIVLFNEAPHFFPGTRDSGETKSETIRLNIRTNRMIRSPAPPNSFHLVTDQEKLWFLPSYSGSIKSHGPFVIEGRPVIVVTYGPNRNLFQILEYKENQWRETDEFVLLPGSLSEVACFQLNGESHFVVYDAGHQKILYRKGLVTGSLDEATRFDKEYAGQQDPLNNVQLHETGWSQFDVPNFMKLEFRNQPWSVYGYRMVNRAPSILFNGQRWHDFSPNRVGQNQGGDAVVLEFRRGIANWNRLGLPHYLYQGTNAADGTNYLVVTNGATDEFCFFVWDKDRFRLLAQTTSPFLWRIVLDGGLLFLIAVVLPMVLLGLFVVVIERIDGPSKYSSGHENELLASVLRRGIARSIDQVIVGVPLLLSIILHPGFVGWWIDVSVTGVELLGWEPYALRFMPRDLSSWLKQCHYHANALSRLLLSPPCVLWLLAPGLAIFIGQTYSQGRCGYTIGKWICGIRVMRTTLRPCGLSRTFLREILTVIDGLFFLSWLPGVLSMLFTTNKQRIGDLLADTVVIRREHTQSRTHL